MRQSHKESTKVRPTRSRNIFTDIKYFLLNKPPNTLVDLENIDERQNYCIRILQRTGVRVEDYKMLNIHKIDVDAPASYLFEELLNWNGDSACWPNHIATVNLIQGNLEKIQINLFGQSLINTNGKNENKKKRLFRLFDLNAIKIKKIPSQDSSDNARFLLYECKGGYPIGIFIMYVRSSIPEDGESGMSQLFIVVSFDFFGIKKLSNYIIINKIWEFFHNRVTSNVAERFKQLSEWRFEKFINDYRKQ